MKKTFEYITEQALDDSGMNVRDTLRFHYFNPNGLYAQKKANDAIISELVDAGLAKTGALFAYGSLDVYHVERLQKACMAKSVISRIALNVLLDSLRSNIAKQSEFIKGAKNG